MYPRLSVNKAIEVRNQIAAAKAAGVSMVDLLKSDFNGLLSHVEEGESTDATTADQLYLTAESIKNTFSDNDLVAQRKVGAVKVGTTQGEYLEELMAEHLHKSLENLDSRALHDPGFWRFLALFPYRWYLLEREPQMSATDYGGCEGSKSYWLLIRTFIIGRKSRRIGKSDEYLNSRVYRDARRIKGMSDGRVIDFYHSHIVRKRWHDNVEISNSFIESCTSAPEALDEGEGDGRHANEFSKSVRRLTPNFLFAALPANELRTRFDSEKKKILGL